MNGVLLKESREGFGHTDTQGDCPMTTEDEIRMMQLQAKKCEGVQATTRSWKRHGRVLPGGLGRDRSPVDALILYFWPHLFSKCEKINLGHFEAPSL